MANWMTLCRCKGPYRHFRCGALLTLVLLGLFVGSTQAQSNPFASTAASGRTVNLAAHESLQAADVFSSDRLSERRRLLNFLHPLSNNHASLILFFRGDCAPCRYEVEHISDYQGIFSSWNVIVVFLTDPNPDFVSHLHDANIPFVDWSNENTKNVLSTFNDPSTTLPYSVALNASQKICAHHQGLLGLNNMRSWGPSC